jgi:DNA-binding CsgD family transcriptional regulator
MASTSERPTAISALTLLQREILVLIVNGLTNREIAECLGLTPGLVGVHIGRRTRVLGVTSRSQLAALGDGAVELR